MCIWAKNYTRKWKITAQVIVRKERNFRESKNTQNKA